MGRKPSALWGHFTKHPKGPYKTPRAACTHCSYTTSATPKNMSTHLQSCPGVATSIGRLAESLEDASGGPDVTPSIAASLQAKAFPSFTRDERSALDHKFAIAVHKTGTEFSLFDHPAFREFFDFLNPVYSPPLSSELSTTLLSDTYQSVLMELKIAMRAAKALTIGVDGATNVLSRSMLNVIVHDPRPWFAEYLKSDLKKESAVEVTRKIVSVVSRLNSFMNPPLTPSEQHDRVIFAFISDSCNLMRAVREALHTQGVVPLTYGCSTHALNIFCEDIAKTDVVKDGIRQAVYVSKTIKNQNLLNKIYSELCRELLGRSYAMVLYSASRWSSINYMFVRLAKVKRAITAVVAAVLNEKDERQIDISYELPPSFVCTVMDGGFWRRVADSVILFDPICKCIGIVESNTATLSTVYACFVYVYLHVGRVMTEDGATALRAKLLYRWNRISTPVHALAFYCDPFYQPFRVAIAESNADSIALDLGTRDLFEQCRNGIALLCRLDDDDAARFDRATKEFYHFSATDGESAKHWGDPARFRPHMIWSQGQRQFPSLSLLMKVYHVPSSSAGVERNHKVAKRIHTASRNRTSRGKVEQQVAVAHNGAVAEMTLNDERPPFEVFMRNNPLLCVSGSEAPGNSEIAMSAFPIGQNGEEDTVAFTDTTINHGEGDDEYFDDVLAEMTDGERLEQETLSAALALSDLAAMPEHILFPSHED